MGRPVIALLVAAYATLLGTVGPADPAAADPPRPTNFESRILEVDPPAPGVTVEVLGGDAFLAVAVARGHTVTVPDYGTDAPPYLRFLADGTVEVNEASAAHASNDSRYGTTGGDREARDGEPRWRTVASDGSHAWHDHRIHLMVPDHLAVTDARGRVDLGGPDGTWEVPLVVDGRPTVVRGELVRLAAPAAWPWWTAAALVTAATLAWTVGLRRPVQPALTVALVVVAAAAVWVSVAEHAAAPADAGASPAGMVVAVVALVAAVTAAGAWVADRHRDRPRPRVETTGRTALAAAAASLLWWAVARRGVIGHALVPSGLPVADRAATSVAAGLAVATAVLLVWRPGVLTRRHQPTPG